MLTAVGVPTWHPRCMPLPSMLCVLPEHERATDEALALSIPLTMVQDIIIAMGK